MEMDQVRRCKTVLGEVLYMLLRNLRFSSTSGLHHIYSSLFAVFARNRPSRSNTVVELTVTAIYS